jgi:dynein heavy chain, axonemal
VWYFLLLLQPFCLGFQDILVTTVDTVRYTWLVQTLLCNSKNVLITGPSGTGKSLCIQRMLDSMNSAAFSNIQTAFSAQTNANHVQDLIESKLSKRQKGVLGPSEGRRAFVFVDDINMPALEVQGAQPPNELIRQWMDYGGWYDSFHSCQPSTKQSFVKAQISVGEPWS